MLSVYRAFCLRTTDSARYINDCEGIEIAKKDGFDRATMNIDFVYYNADYYYMWEEAQRLAGQCVEKKAEEFGLKNFDKEKKIKIESDNKGFCNFNSLMSCRTGVHIINENAVPPKGFSLFYREKFIYGGPKGSEHIGCNTLIVNGGSMSEENKVNLPDEYLLKGAYPKRNYYQQIGFNAYEYYQKHMSGMEGSKSGGVSFLSNFVLYSFTALHVDNTREMNQASEVKIFSVKGHTYRTQLEMYAEQVKEKRNKHH